MNEAIAVIIPTFNRAHMLSRAVDSVLAQTRQAAEVCIVDDGSTDETEALVTKCYPQALFVKQGNSGVSAARNAGIAATRSPWIAFLDSDDEWLPQKLALQIAALQSQPDLRLVHSDEIWIRGGRRVNQMNKHRKRGGYIFPFCLPLCVISPSAVIIHRSLLSEVGGFDESLPACEDYDLWLKICSVEEVLYVDKPLLKKYGGHEDQLSSLHWGMDRFRVQSLDTLLKGNRLSADQRLLAKKTLIEKATILKNGAEKRNNLDRALFFQALIEKHAD